MLSSKILFILLCITVSLQAGIPEIEYEEFTLDNGLKVFLHRDTSTPIVAVTVTYHVGSKNESADRTGFAHFFEHLMFDGTENIERGRIDKLIQNAGGRLNAYTSFDETAYYFLLPSNQLEMGLWIESERMLHLRVDSISVETQRKVVKEERKQSVDNRPYGSFYENIFSSSFNVHPYQWTPIGSAQYIDQATVDEFMAFYDTYYVPNNAVLSIAGDIDLDKTRELVELYFGTIPKGKEIERPAMIEPVQTAEVRDTVYDNIQLPLVALAFHSPALGTEDYYALELLSKILSDGQSSRLYKALVDEGKQAVSTAAFQQALEDPGLFIIYAIANVGFSADELEKAIRSELDSVKSTLISENEFQKILNQTESDFIREKSRVQNIAQSLALYHIFFGDADLINDELERYLDVKPEDILETAKKYLKDENATILYYLPKTTENNSGSGQ